MNKAFKSLALVALATSSVCADTFVNHTTLTLRSHGYNLPLNYTTFNELINHKADDQFGGRFQVIPFYQETNSGKELGKYFGMNGNYNMLLGHIANGAALTGADLDLAYMIHDSTATAASEAYIKFDPKSVSYGATFAYYQDLEKITKGLFLSVSLPVVRIENDMKMAVSIPSANATSATTVAQIQSYFAGTLTHGVSSTYDVQEALAKAKIEGKRCETGVADIEVKLGYNFLEKENYRLGLNVGTTIPTGEHNKAFYVFPATIGNDKHWALGAGLEGFYRVWEKEDQNIKLGMALDYRFLFENTQWRTPALKNADGSVREWGQYHLLGSVGGTNITTLTPAANVITQKCHVTPGSQLEGLANVAYNYGGFTFDLGYNIFWREREEVTSLQTLVADTYGVANRALVASANTVDKDLYGGTTADVTAANFGVKEGSFDEVAATASGSGSSTHWISQSNLDFSKAETPAVLSHKVYSGLGYSFKEWDTPLMMGIGGSYEFATENSTPDFWMIYGKLGVAF